MMQVDEGYAALHGLPEGTVETTRSEWRARVHPDDVARAVDTRQQVLQGQLSECIEYRIVRSGAEVRWIELRSFITYTTPRGPLPISETAEEPTARRAELRVPVSPDQRPGYPTTSTPTVMRASSK